MNRHKSFVARVGILVALVTTSSGGLASQTLYSEGEASRSLLFGFGVEVAGDRIFVGEPGRIMNPGAVFVYGQQDDSWNQVAEVSSPDSVIGNGFGQDVAADVGVFATWIGVPETRTRVVFVFKEDTLSGLWTQTARLPDPESDPQSNFADAIAISMDWLVVGAPLADSRRGRVHVFRRGDDGWVEHSTLSPPAGAEPSFFGFSVDVSEDRIVVGAPVVDGFAGAAFTYRLSLGEWIQDARLQPEETQPNSIFGAAVAIQGRDLAVSAPNRSYSAGTVHLFERESRMGAWSNAGTVASPDAASRDRFATDVALDEGTLVVSAPTADRGRGAAYLFTGRQSGSVRWEGEQRLAAADLSPNDQFANSVSIDGEWAVFGTVGAQLTAGGVSVFRRTSEGWVEHSTLESETEALPAISGDGAPCANGDAGGFECSDVDIVSFLPLPEMGGGRGIQLNDLWAWTDSETGKDYALIGRTDGTAFVDVSDPSSPVYVAEMLRTKGTPIVSWRDVKVYADHAFVVADGAPGHGMQILDLRRLRDFTGEPLLVEADVIYEGVSSAHNIFINEETGFAYVVGSKGSRDCGPGLHIVDVRDPKNPRFAGCFSDPLTGRQSDGYTHDTQCVLYHGPDEAYSGREICFSSNETALSIADITDKELPVAISRASYPQVAYAHQGWLTEDHRYFFLGDELDEGNDPDKHTRTLVWDVISLEDPVLVTEYRSPAEATDHNLYIRGNLMYQANYEAGMRIVDISDPANPVEVGFFDTVPYREDNLEMAGAWTAYPFLDGGLILVSSRWEGLFILRKSGQKPVT